jgi:hypothetical protein
MSGINLNDRHALGLIRANLPASIRDSITGSVTVCDYTFLDTKEPRETKKILLQQNISLFSKVMNYARTFWETAPRFEGTTVSIVCEHLLGREQSAFSEREVQRVFESGKQIAFYVSQDGKHFLLEIR